MSFCLWGNGIFAIPGRASLPSQPLHSPATAAVHHPRIFLRFPHPEFSKPQRGSIETRCQRHCEAAVRETFGRNDRVMRSVPDKCSLDTTAQGSKLYERSQRAAQAGCCLKMLLQWRIQAFKIAKNQTVGLDIAIEFSCSSVVVAYRYAGESSSPCCRHCKSFSTLQMNATTTG